MKHVLLHQDWLEGWQYGTHKAFEDAIVEVTGAEIVVVPENQLEKKYRRLDHGGKFQVLRKALPKKILNIKADVAWHILMAPGDYNLDLFKNWYKDVKYRIVYVFDTLEPIEKALINAFSDDTFNIRITSFNDAVPYMEKITGQKWYSIEQATSASLFECTPDDQRVIPFASYGRREDGFHKALLEFVEANNLYYDFSTYNGTLKIKFDPNMYKQYAWHVSHSMFNICWPVELTSPLRAGSFHPITCRWFEVAAAGTCILGRKPANSYFNECLHPDLVIDIDPFQKRDTLLKNIEKVWVNKDKHLVVAKQIRDENIHRWTWKNRVERILEIIDTLNSNH